MTKDIIETQVVVVGAGMSGLCTAWVLHQQGVEVAVIDRTRECPPVFRAEKLEPNQAELLRQFGLLDARRPLAEPPQKRVKCEGNDQVKLKSACNSDFA